MGNLEIREALEIIEGYDETKESNHAKTEDAKNRDDSDKILHCSSASIVSSTYSPPHQDDEEFSDGTKCVALTAFILFLASFIGMFLFFCFSDKIPQQFFITPVNTASDEMVVDSKNDYDHAIDVISNGKVDDLCSDEHLEDEIGRESCYMACEPAKCCFESGESSCLNIETKEWCSMFSSCPH